MKLLHILAVGLAFVAAGDLRAWEPRLWNMETAPGGAALSEEVPAAFIYDPLTQKSWGNRHSLISRTGEKGPILEEKIAPVQDGSFTLECFVKAARDPQTTEVVAALGPHAIGVNFLRQWEQCYWSAFSDATHDAAWQTGHYVTISRLVADKAENNLAWRHLALVYDARRGTLSAVLDYWQASSQRLDKPLKWDGTVSIGAAKGGARFEGLIDEVRLTPAALEPHQFLRAVPAELSGISFDSPDATFPRDAGHLDIRRHFGAVGDGRHDDTAAFVKAMAESERERIIYVPDGTYLVSDTIYWNHFRLLRGQSEARTIIRLKDRTEGFGDPAHPKPVLRCYFNQNESIQNFIQHLTVDTGSANPGAIGIRYCAHNQGELSNVTIRSGDGSGALGLDIAETEFGPALVQDLTVQGFDVGIKTPGNVSHATMERVTLRGQRVAGMQNSLPLSLRGLRSDNSVPAIINRGWMGQLILLDADLRGGGDGQSAILFQEGASGYLRNIHAEDYGQLLRDETPKPPQQIAGPTLAEHLIGETHTFFGQKAAHLNLPIDATPASLIEPPARWITPDAAGDDDTDAIQKAFDSGAATIYLRRGVQYKITRTLRVPESIRRIVGMKADVHGDPKVFGKEMPLLRIEGRDSKAPPLHIEHLSLSAYPEQRVAYQLASARDVVIQWSSGWLTNTAEATGRLFMDEQMSWVHLLHPQRAWLRQLDTETTGDYKGPPHTYVINRGGQVWIMGFKTESVGIHVDSSDGASTEILGGFFRDHHGSRDVPYFKTTDSRLSATYLQHAWAPGAARALQGIETQHGTVKSLMLDPNNAVIGIYRAGE